MWEELKLAWPILTVLASLSFAVGVWVQGSRSLAEKATAMDEARAKEDKMRDEAARDRESRIRLLEGRPSPGMGVMCANHQDKLTEFGVTVREIRASLRRIEKKLEVNGGEEEE